MKKVRLKDCNLALFPSKELMVWTMATKTIKKFPTLIYTNLLKEYSYVIQL